MIAGATETSVIDMKKTTTDEIDDLGFITQTITVNLTQTGVHEHEIDWKKFSTVVHLVTWVTTTIEKNEITVISIIETIDELLLRITPRLIFKTKFWGVTAIRLLSDSSVMSLHNRRFPFIVKFPR